MKKQAEDTEEQSKKAKGKSEKGKKGRGKSLCLPLKKEKSLNR